MYWNPNPIVPLAIIAGLTLTWDVLKLKANKNMILQLTWLTLTWDVLKFVIIA